MANRTNHRRKVKCEADGEAMEVVRDHLEELARKGAREMLMKALDEEVDAYLGRGRYERTGEYHGYRNGSTPRRLTLGAGTINLGTPRVRDIPEGQEPFESKILRKHQRRSDTIDETFLNLFVEGLATRDFEPALRLLVGQKAPLSPSTVSRLTRQFKGQYDAFDDQELSDRRFVYIWADGIYLKAGLGTEKACLMVLIGADREGVKHLIALREGYRESAESWGDLIRDCRRRGMNEPACWIADGALGLWAAVDEQTVSMSGEIAHTEVDRPLVVVRLAACRCFESEMQAEHGRLKLVPQRHIVSRLIGELYDVLVLVGRDLD